MKSLFFNIMKNALLEVGQLRRLAISPVFNSVYRSFKRKLQKNCIPLFVNSFFFTKQKILDLSTFHAFADLLTLYQRTKPFPN